MRPHMIRQGDVLVRPTERRPTDQAKLVTDKGRVILAYGEVTGHAHEVIGGVLAISAEPDGPPQVIVPEDLDLVPAMELFEEPDGSRILVVKRAALLKHEEHGPIYLVPGGYEVIRQREYSPGAIRTVAD